MTTPTVPWERRLFALAHAPTQQSEAHVAVDADYDTLRRAYAYCSQVTREHSKTFHMASALLPAEKRRAVRALYAFCRTTDDLVDRSGGDPLSDLERWREQALGAPTADDPVVLAWADTIARYQIPTLYAHQLIDGVARDITVRRYGAFEQLAEYAYGVASTVGLMSMHIVGYDGPHAIPYAVKLGVALQLTNILRDIHEDWTNDRLYLPLDELERFGLSEADVAARRLTDRWRAFVDFQIARNHKLYEEALPGIALLHRDGRFAIRAAAELYRGILDDIHAHQGDVFSRRAHVTTWGKLRRLPGIWWRAQRSSAPAKREST
ncbi:MAG: squalene/phytoene synthase family protein [Anaerolineae bacterium]|nr:squalene/phytoene synthase family protein [Anaerolineae bacterium]